MRLAKNAARNPGYFAMQNDRGHSSEWQISRFHIHMERRRNIENRGLPNKSTDAGITLRNPA
jgi:hypothetical protein